MVLLGRFLFFYPAKEREKTNEKKISWFWRKFVAGGFRCASSVTF
jgi:hypothetical protein